MDGHERCIERGGLLAVPRDQNQLDRIRYECSRKNNLTSPASCWIGGYNKEPRGYEFVDNRTVIGRKSQW